MASRYSILRPGLFLLLALLACVGGKHMTQVNTPPPPNPNALVSGVAWCGTQFVAVGGMAGVGGIVITSHDGTAWTAKALNTYGFRGVAWAGSPSAVVARLPHAGHAPPFARCGGRSPPLCPRADSVAG